MEQISYRRKEYQFNKGYISSQTANIILNKEKLDSYFLGCSLIPLLLNFSTRVLAKAIRKKAERKLAQTNKEESRLSVFANAMIGYRKPQDSNKQI